MKKLQSLLNQLEAHIPNYEKRNETISQSNVGWQLAHSLLVIDVICTSLKNSNPKEYKWRFNKNRFLVLTILKKIPRGVGKAPKVVQPYEEINSAQLKKQLELLRNKITEFESFSTKNYFKHPYFGDLHLKDTLYFLELHTKHHLKIIEDILTK